MSDHRPKAISGEHRVWVLERTKQDFTLRGLVAELAERGLKVDYRSVWEFVNVEKPSFKKSVVAGERDRPDVARRLAQWIKYQDSVEPERLVFIDETWTRTDMAPLWGWAPRGQRLPTSPSARSSSASRPKNAKTISPSQDMDEPNFITLRPRGI